MLVVCLIAPFVLDQLAALRARGGGSPIVVAPYGVFGEAFPTLLRRVLDIPAYWLVLLPIELPAASIAGVLALRRGVAQRHAAGPERLASWRLACLAGTGLLVSWLLVRTLGENNDLGLRAIIPAEMVLIVIVAAAAAIFSARCRAAIVAMALAGLALSLPDTAMMIHNNIAGKQRPGGEIFAQTPELWAAVRRYAAPDARVANNPLFLSDVTPWPVNISWALLANRSSCFAGRELALAFAPLPPAAPRGDQRAVHPRLRREGHRGRRETTWRRNMAARSSSSCRRTGHGTKTRSPRAPTIGWRKAATAAGGFTCGSD